MKKLIFSLLLLLPLVSKGQQKVTFDLVTGWEYSYRILNYSGDEIIYQHILESRSEERGKFNARGGVNYNRKLTSNLWLKSGIRVADIGYYGKKYTGLIFESEINSGQQDPTLPSESQIIYHYWFAEVPLMLRWEAGQHKISPFIEIGTSQNVYIVTRTTQMTDLGTTHSFGSGSALGFNRFHLTGNVSVGVNIRFHEHYAFFFQPIARFHLTKLANGPIGEHLYNFGVETGVRKTL